VISNENRYINLHPKMRPNAVPNEKNSNTVQNPENDKEPAVDAPNSKVKFEIYGEEMLEKRV
jgi:hypothetical protein